jgi:glycogen phosphorylase
MPFSFQYPYSIDAAYSKPVAYFCMEYALHQPLKMYAGGLGFLAGSYLRAAFEMRQNIVGVGILWKYGYYDQVRKSDQSMDVLFQEKVYAFLRKTDIRFTLCISGHDVWVTAYYLPPGIFSTAPLFLLSTDLPENDYLARTICHKLYDPNPETRTAAAILLGIGGVKLFDYLDWKPEIYHLNESHALPLAFYLYRRFEDLDAVKKRFVFTNHTPEDSGNPRTDMFLLERMGYFDGVPLSQVKTIAGVEGNLFNHALAALRLASLANGVSALHLQTLQKLWAGYAGICPMIAVTNAQHATYWADREMYQALEMNDDNALLARKTRCKEELFETVADQNGEIFDKNILTIVFAKRFAGYKRADLLLRNMDRFNVLVNNKERPVQIIWAGKPFPMDYAAIAIFDRIVDLCKSNTNCAILVGYELKLSKMLKQGADVWLNVPRITHEASGTSGMSAAMNGAVNVSIPDGWFPEFAQDGINSFVIPAADPALPEHQQDDLDAAAMYDVLEKKLIPMYYDQPLKWQAIMKSSLRSIVPQFDSNRLVQDYYNKMYKHH